MPRDENTTDGLWLLWLSLANRASNSRTRSTSAAFCSSSRSRRWRWAAFFGFQRGNFFLKRHASMLHPLRNSARIVTSAGEPITRTIHGPIIAASHPHVQESERPSTLCDGDLPLPVAPVLFTLWKEAHGCGAAP